MQCLVLVPALFPTVGPSSPSSRTPRSLLWFLSPTKFIWKSKIDVSFGVILVFSVFFQWILSEPFLPARLLAGHRDGAVDKTDVGPALWGSGCRKGQTPHDHTTNQPSRHWDKSCTYVRGENNRVNLNWSESQDLFLCPFRAEEWENSSWVKSESEPGVLGKRSQRSLPCEWPRGPGCGLDDMGKSGQKVGRLRAAQGFYLKYNENLGVTEIERERGRHRTEACATHKYKILNGWEVWLFPLFAL